MSTQINVTVGSGGLSDKARQLQTAARQAQLEKERQQRIETQGQEQRAANLAAAGRAPDGSPLFGPGFKQPEVERRPAASRSGSLGILLIPSSNYTEYGGTLSGLRGTSRNAKPPIFSRYSVPTEQSTPVEYGEGTFLLSGGPSGSNALELKPTIVYGPPPPIGMYLDLTDNQLYEYYSQAYQGPTSTVEQTQLVYASISDQYDTVLEWQSLNAFNQPPPPPPYKILNLNGQFVVPNAKTSYNKLQDFTHEFLVRNPIIGQDNPTSLVRQVDQSLNRSASYQFRAAGVRINFLARQDNPVVSRSGISNSGSLIDGQNITVRWVTVSSNFFYQISIVAESLARSTSPTSAFGISFGQPFGPNPPEFLSFLQQDWTHVAVCRKLQEEGYRWYIYINGIDVTLGDGFIIEQPGWVNTYGTQPPSALLNMSSLLANPLAGPPMKPAFHGYRFTPKALYANSFTPPSSITSFA